MARFPTREADIRILVQSIIAGLKDNPDFPNPPVSPEQLQTLLDNSIALEDAQVAAQAAAQQATEALETEITLNNQERGKEHEYRVIAVNKAGESDPSNTVTAVL